MNHEFQGQHQETAPAVAWSASKSEEVIACLWSILWAVLWSNEAPSFVLWFVGVKAILDHACAIKESIKEQDKKNAEIEP